MSFLYPLGLLGLIGIPILIIIYILKNKYTEQTISSTYLWRLSEKFLKKKKPISKISGIISLILQIVLIILISLSIAHPVITLPNTAKEYCFILDGSGSMNMIENENSRFDNGKNEIKTIINESVNGSTYTLIYAASGTRIVYEKLADKEKAIELLDSLESSDLSVSTNSAMVVAQNYFNENNAVKTYLITDKNYTVNNLELIKVGSEVDNYAISKVDYGLEGNILKISGSVISYLSDETLTVQIYINNTLDKELEVDVTKLEEVAFTYDSTNIDFNSIKVAIKNSDGLMKDNEYIIYNVEKDHDYKTLIVSERPFYLESMLNTVGNTYYDVISPEKYNTEVSGYGLYIYDSFNPTKLPTDGTIWLFNLDTSLPECGFSIQDKFELEEAGELVPAKAVNSIAKKLTKGLVGDKIYISKYVKYGLYRNFTTLLTYEGNPVIFTGTNNNGSREVVFAFDLHDSNFTMLMDYLILSKNLLDYSFPVILDDANYVCGQTLEVNVLSSCDSIRVTSPKGNVSYMDISSEISEYHLTEVGTYTLTMMMGDEIKTFSVYSSMAKEESYSNPLEVNELSLQGEASNDYSDGIYDELIILFILLAVIFVADWMVYCYEQYQLR